MAQSNKPVPSAEQQRIVDADANANVIVVAGAGSGKTFTMTERVIHLIHEGVPPEHISGSHFHEQGRLRAAFASVEGGARRCA